jgi:hypothetical protein
MDDILIFTTLKELLEWFTKRVLERLRQHDLYLKPKKCKFCKEKVEYLGMIIEVWSFLGFGNFYRHFIRKFSEIAQPLNELLKKDKKFEWTLACQKAFNTLKDRFTEEPVLMMPDHSKPFQIESDASKYATGAVLTQLDSNGDRHPVAFISKTLTETKWNYKIYDQELLGIVQALEEWRHYIQGSGHVTTVHTDHKNLSYFQTAQWLNRRQAQWALYLSEFDLKLIHLPGLKMILSDALSQWPDHTPDEDHDNEDVVLLPDNLFINLLDLDLQKCILNSEKFDFDTADAIKSLLHNGPTPLHNNLKNWHLEEIDRKQSLFYKGKNYIPQDIKLRRDLVKMFHDHETAGHPGKLETYNSIRQHYWWPGMRS